MQQRIVKLAEEFTEEVPHEQKAKYWKEASDAFRVFWTNKILNDDTKDIKEFEDLDQIMHAFVYIQNHKKYC